MNYYARQHGRCYHREDCGMLFYIENGERKRMPDYAEITEEEIKLRGLIPCPMCITQRRKFYDK
jgi:hypothetical protein